MPDEPLEPNETDDFIDAPSKSQRKREMHALKDLGEQLLDIPEDQLERLSNPDLIEAVLACKRITKGNARKRQLQYIGKILRKNEADVEEVHELVDRFDARSKAHVALFHQLEQWRESLIAQDPNVLDEISAQFPDVDRQHLRQLTRNAIDERNEERQPPVHFRKLFQYLKSLAD